MKLFGNTGTRGVSRVRPERQRVGASTATAVLDRPAEDNRRFRRGYRNVINEALQAMHADGTLTELSQRYFGGMDMTAE